MMPEDKRVTTTGEDSGRFEAGEVRVTLRSFVPSDFAQVIRIEAVSFPVNAYSELEFTRLCREYPGEFVVAEVAGNVVGYVAGSTTDDAGKIESIAVDPHFRWLGIGRMLIEHLLDRFRKLGLHRCVLEVRTTNAVAIDLYQRLSFQIVGVSEGYYADGADALLMEKAIH